MYLRREDHLIFHGCVPVDGGGDLLPMTLDGQAYRAGSSSTPSSGSWSGSSTIRPGSDLDLLWYLWSGPRLRSSARTGSRPWSGTSSPTPLARGDQEPLLLADPRALVLRQDPEEFGVDPDRGLIVNGHVPVKIEKGESPIKRSGKAITIDGAFSEAYGDHGYTLVLEADRTFLACHHHFQSVEAAVRDGVDIIPSISVVRTWDRPRTMADTERGTQFRCEIAILERLIDAYRHNDLRQRT